MKNSRHCRRRSGFTLIELLVVIGIVSVLAALGAWGAYAAIVAGRKAAISYELNQLQQSLEKYKQDIGDYPPDCTNTNLVKRHIRTYYRRYTGTPPGSGTYPSYFNTSGTPVIDPSEALVFWLVAVDTSAQAPFAASAPANLAAAKIAVQDSNLSRFQFKPGQLTDPDGDGWPSYCPLYTDLSPYAYFHHATYASANARFAHPTGATNGGVARPYYSSASPVRFIAPQKFQIISTGLDGSYGANAQKVFPIGTNYVLADEDNITSFSEGATLGDKRP